MTGEFYFKETYRKKVVDLRSFQKTAISNFFYLVPFKGFTLKCAATIEGQFIGMLVKIAEGNKPILPRLINVLIS